MIKEGYTERFSLATVASAGFLGIIIPPSIPMVIYSMALGISVTDVFLGGVIPCIMLACGKMCIRDRLAYIAIDYACYLFVIKALAGSQTSPAMHIPMVIMYIIIMVGFVLATVAQLANMVEEYVHHTTETEEAEK